jgi:hypothetical protein
MREIRKFSIADTLQGMRTAFEEHRVLVIRTTLLFAVLNALTGMLDLTGPAGIAISVGFLVLFTATYDGLITALVCVPGRPDGIGELWQAVRPVLGALVWVAVIYTAAVVAGMLALIVPGLMILTIWSVSSQVVLVERSGIFTSFRRSAELVRGNGFPVFWFLVLIGIISLTISLLSILVASPLGTGLAGDVVSIFLTNMFSAPFYALGSASLYNQLAGRGVNQEPEEPPAIDQEW